MKPDEVLFLKELCRMQYARRRPNDEFATDVGVRLGLHEKRAAYMLEKWSGKGWWECGVSLRTGWLTEKGLEAARRLG